MSYLKHYRTTGELSPIQVQTLKLLASGLDHREVAERIGRSRVSVTQNGGAIVAKMGARNTAHAVAIYSRYEAYHSAAAQLERARLPSPLGEAEEHVNHVLEGLAAALRATGDRLLPR